ncbi:MAG: hypothetical protein ABR906_03950 [Terracidiphilus sp.]|jgi:hypothetical protein
MVNFARMLSFEDDRWLQLAGGYKLPFDPRLLLSRLEIEHDPVPVWHELWDELHHQGDVGEASYAAVPHLVRIYRKRGIVDWNTYAIVAIIELARNEGKNPDVPKWLEQDYFRAIRELAEIGAAEVLRINDPEAVRAMLSIVAIDRGLLTHGKFLVKYSENELLDIESRL